MNILVSCDENYLNPLKTMLYSLFESNDTNFEIPYGEIKKLRKKKYLLIFQTKDQHIIILDKLQMSIAQQDELHRIIHKKMPWLRARGLA